MSKQQLFIASFLGAISLVKKPSPALKQTAKQLSAKLNKPKWTQGNFKLAA